MKAIFKLPIETERIENTQNRNWKNTNNILKLTVKIYMCKVHLICGFGKIGTFFQVHFFTLMKFQENKKNFFLVIFTEGKLGLFHLWACMHKLRAYEQFDRWCLYWRKKKRITKITPVSQKKMRSLWLNRVYPELLKK